MNGDATDIITDLRHPERYRIASLLRSLAYEATSFQRASMLLARFVMAEPLNNNHNATSRLFKDLFHLYLSGTHASIKQRLKVIDTLLKTADDSCQECGLGALHEMLKTQYFTSTHNFEFGARSRDYGWQPRTVNEEPEWFHEVIHFVLDLISSNSPLTTRLCSILASNFRGLWTDANIYDDLESVVATITSKRFWSQGWISVRTTLRLDVKNMPPDVLQRLHAIEETLRPSQLVEEARAYVFSQPWNASDLADSEEDDLEDGGSSYQRVVERTQAIGREVATNSDVLVELLLDISHGEDNGNRWSFGIGLAKGAQDIETMWKTLVGAIASVSENERNIQVLRGFLSQAVCLAPDKVAVFLDAAVSNPVLGPWFPVLQCSVDIDERGVNRLLAAVQHGVIPVGRYRQLVDSRVTDPIPSDDLRRLLTAISLLPDGFEVAVEILYMKLWSNRQSGVVIDHDLIECGRGLLLQCACATYPRIVDRKLACFVETCLTGIDGEELAKVVCTRLVVAFETCVSIYEYADLLKSLFLTQPNVTLTVFLTQEHISITRSLMRNIRSAPGHPLDELPLDLLIAWAKADETERFPALASVIRLFVGGDDEGCESVSPKAIGLLDAAPNKEAVLSCYEDRFQPSCWSGSLADILEKRQEAIQKLSAHPDPIVVDWANKWNLNLTEWIKQERPRVRSADGSFE